MILVKCLSKGTFLLELTGYTCDLIVIRPMAFFPGLNMFIYWFKIQRETKFKWDEMIFNVPLTQKFQVDHTSPTHKQKATRQGK